MKTKQILIALLLVAGLLVANVSSALALPLLPCSFYGYVTINGAPVAAGTIVSAYIDGVWLAQDEVDIGGGGLTSYTVNVPAEYEGNPGGEPGDTVTFKIGDVAADQTGTWTTDGNIQIDLTATVNYPPAITETDPYAFTIAEDSGMHTFSLHATDPNAGDTLTWGIDTAALHGTVGAAGTGGTGGIDYTPNANYNGSDTFIIEVTDGTLTDTITVNATITAVNDTPSFNKGSNPTVNEDAGAQTLNGWATAISDGDPEVAQTLTFNVTGNTNTALFSAGPAISSTGTLTFTPTADANGSATITITLSDDGTPPATSPSQDFTISVTAVNDAPTFTKGGNQTVAEDAGAQTAAGWATGMDDGDDDLAQSLTFYVTGNTSTGLFSAGPAIDAATGALTYTPAADKNGTATITLELRDNGSNTPPNDNTSDPQTFTITVTPVNDKPTANAQMVSTNEDTAKAITLTGSDVDSDPLAYSIVTPPVNGDLSGTPPGVTYTPDPGYNGSDSFTFKVNDGTTDSDPATVSITVAAINDAPSFTKGADQTDDEDAGAQTVVGWATGMNDGDDELTQALTFNITGNTNTALFAVAPAIDATTGTLTYTPAANANGTATITITLSDNGTPPATSPSQSFVITVNAINDEPSFTKGGNQTVNEDTGLQTVNGWATAISDGDSELSQTLIFDVSNDNNALFSAQPAVSAAGVLTFTPAANANGSATVSVYLTDSGSGTPPNDNTSPTQTFTITVNPVNDAPTFTKGIDQTVNEDAGAQTVAAWATAMNDGDTDADQAPLTFNVTGNTNAALFSVAPAVDAVTGTLTYTPAANANGTATISLTLSDSGSSVAPNVNTSGAQTFTITVNARNDPPSFTKGGNQTVAEDAGAQTVNNWATAIDDGDPEATQTLIFTTSNDNNALFSAQPAVSSAGVLTYTPAANANGVATVSVYLTDSGSGTPPDDNQSDTQTFTISVTAVNDAPVANAQSVSTLENTAVAITLTGSDIDGGDLTYSIVANPSHGALSGTPPNVTYTPTSGYNGADSFTFKINDTFIDGNTATVTINVGSVNEAPVITEGATIDRTMSEDGAPTAFSLTLNATDGDGDTLTWSISTQATNGTASASGTGASKAITYAPNLNYNGADSFVVQVSDGQGGSDTITVNVTIEAVNDAPVITQTDPVAVTMSEDGSPTAFGLTLNASDVDAGATLTWTISTAATNGTAGVTAPGTGTSMAITYAPTANYNGSDSFVVQVSDGTAVDTVTVNVTIQPVNDAPDITQTSPQAVTMSEDGAPTVFALTLNATDPDTGDTLTWTISTAAVNGTAAIPSPGTGASISPTYAPNTNYNGSDSFVVQVSDGTLADTVTVNVTIQAVNDPPVANNQTVTTNKNVAIAITLTGSDVEGSTLRFFIVTNPTNGALSGTEPNITYTPNSNFSGTDSFTFRANDGGLDSNPNGTITVNVTQTNSAPIAQNQSVTTNEDTAKAITLVATDNDGDTLNYTILTNPTNGTLTGTPPNVTYTPNANFNGSDSFTFKAADALVDSNTATVSITVSSVNDAPVLAAIGARSVNELATLSFTASATDDGGGAITYSLSGAPSGASINNTSGAFTWTPTEAQGPSSNSFSVCASDGTLSTCESITVTVNEVNQAPVLDAIGSKTVQEGSLLSFTANAYDNDQPANTLTYSLVGAPTGASINPSTGVFTWTPTDDQGPTVYIIDVVVSDGTATDSESVQITVTQGAPPTYLLYLPMMHKNP